MNSATPIDAGKLAAGSITLKVAEALTKDTGPCVCSDKPREYAPPRRRRR
jgi:hypothetical protein